MTNNIKKTVISCLFLAAAASASAQIKLNTKAIGALQKGAKAVTISDEDAAKLAKESIDWMDAHNPVASANDPYTIRLNKIFGKHKNEDGLTLNYKVYKVVDINAFACADGSIRVFSALMDKMTDEELLAIIGHEIGHVKNHDTRDAMRSAYKRAAINDAASSQSGVISALSDTQLGVLANSMLESKFSRKQETQADDYGYEFLKKHKYNVMAMSTAFKKLQSLSSGEKQSKMQKMMSSHPDSGDRAAAVEQKAKKDGLTK
ncbi:M48 family metallopeptidase [Pedobacter sp. MC2016-14]|uniref:M48 family metallopeptidase n=1 Tax=Pedobacter sp. MC2016-14 TaxID=2897327 RepID=UPI001E598A46|nr:M48 family metallopeptidase [Pedobacter sp. MC2016-14]MCD0490109.1 M48 family metallopeptidase [Pedobacter sp. MC2016-14]